MDIGAVDRAIRRWGGVDVAFAGIGLNGHVACNEPPAASECWTDESFARSPTRVVKLAETTKATNSIFGTGGDLGRVPDFAVTIGMKEILGARRVHVFLDWRWQRFVFRRALLGPVAYGQNTQSNFKCQPPENLRTCAGKASSNPSVGVD